VVLICVIHAVHVNAVPAFPLELEREIFIIAALSSPTSVPVLRLVAVRVSEWQVNWS